MGTGHFQRCLRTEVPRKRPSRRHASLRRDGLDLGPWRSPKARGHGPARGVDAVGPGPAGDAAAEMCTELPGVKSPEKKGRSGRRAARFWEACW